VPGSRKIVVRTTVAEPIGETLAELPFIGDQVVCLSHEPGRAFEQTETHHEPVYSIRLNRSAFKHKQG
jgi:hypothetical protein